MSEIDDAIDQIESHAALYRELRLRAEIDDLKSANALLHALISNRDADIERLRAALRMVLENQGGHQHWDSFGTAGANCPICQHQQEAAMQGWEALKALEGKR